MKNFAIFLLLANLALWGWQFVFYKNELSVSKEIGHTRFVQADKKLRMLGDVPLELRTGNSDQNRNGEADALHESDLATAALSADVASAVPVVNPPLEPWCGATNNVSSLERTKSFRAEWLKKAGEADEESVKESSSSTWWVYLPFKDEGAAQLVLKQLHDKEIDSYYMRTGDLAGGISLGVFSRKESALSIRDGLRKKGYAAEVKEVLRMESRIRLVLRLNDSEKIHESIVKELLNNYRDIQVKEIACK